MTHKPYIMKIEEIQVLVAGLVSHGANDTYNRMKAKSILSMDQKDDIDEMLLDMSETMLQKGREDLGSVVEREGEPTVSSIYYSLAFMLRKLAHEIYRLYIKKGKKRDSNRFIRLVSYNENAPLIIQ